MDTKSFLTAVAFVATFPSIAATPEIRCNFNQGIPADFTLVDADGNTLAPGLAKYGFVQGDAWVAYKIEDEDNSVASSTSWYNPAGTSSDWMILPALSVTDGATLSWRAKAFDSRHRDGYAVYVSDKGGDIADFDTAQPLFSVGEEESGWTFHSVDLSPYKGTDVHIAFVNNSTDKSRLFIDDIAAGVSSGICFEYESASLFATGKELVINGFITTQTGLDITGYSLTIEIDGQILTKDFPDAVLHSGERQPVEWATGFVPSRKGTYDYTITVRHDDIEAETSGSIRVAGHRVVVEEGTGTWCGWCIRGIVAIRDMKAAYPDNFVAIAVHSNDDMELDEYKITDVTSIPGLPYATVNRVNNIDPNSREMEEAITDVLNSGIRAGIDISASIDDDRSKLNVTSEVCFPTFYSDQDYRLIYIVTENNVHHPGDPEYNQQNSYSGGSETMGGFENMPNPIPSEDMYFDDVARCAAGGHSGIAGSIPSTMKAGETAEFSYSFDLPSNIDNIDQAELVVMIYDYKAKEILNAEILKLSDIGQTSVDAIGTEGQEPTLRYIPGGIAVDNLGDCMPTLQLWTMDGRMIAQSKSSSIKTDMHGIMLLRVVGNDRCTVMKVRL